MAEPRYFVNSYIYDGPVKQFGKVIGVFQGETQAMTRERALSNFAYRAKKARGLSSEARIELDKQYLKEV